MGRAFLARLGTFFPSCVEPVGSSATYSPKCRGTILASKNKRRGAGHTLVEIAIALSVLAIIASIGFFSLSGTLSRYRFMKTARLLQTDLQTMRSLAISTSRQTRVHLLAADTALGDVDSPQVGAWELQIGNRSSRSTRWDTLPPDDADGTVDDSEGLRDIGVGGGSEAPRISLAPWPALEGPGTDNTDCIVFSPRGWVDNPPSDLVSGSIVLEVVDKVGLSRSEPTSAARIVLSRGGASQLEITDRMARAPGSIGSQAVTTP